MKTWAKKLGLINIASSTVMEREWSLMSDETFSFHVARISLPEGASTSSALREMLMSTQLEETSVQLAGAEVDIICFGCTVGSLLGGSGWDQELIDRIERVSGIQATTTATEVVRAFQAVNANTLAVATPYLEDMNQLEKMFFESKGFKILTIKGLQLETDIGIGQQTPKDVASLVQEVYSPEADCIFISCTNFRSFEIIELLEQKFGVPVISSIQASLWGLLNRVGLTKVSNGVGTLMRC